MSALTVPVALGARSYDVLIGPDALETGAARLPQYCPRGRALIAADRAAFAAHGERLISAVRAAGLTPLVHEIEGGERAKSWAGLDALTGWMLDQGMERGEALIAFGGGTLGDLAGFAAAVMKRGCGFIQIPTTLLAQVDSSVGGKTGINTPQGKNLIGAFHQPALVIADTRVLDTLPEREIRAGYAEIIKAGLIADAPLFERLEALGPKALQGDALVRAIADAVAFKARIVAEDETERGVRALLNLGHTFAHAFEAEARPGALVHGEAVAAGLVLAFRYSVRRGLCPQADADRAEAHIAAAGLPARIADLPGGPYEPARLTARMGSDKKNTGGAITLVLARAIGEAMIAPGADAADLTAFLQEETDR
ncbi:3-dehydroquinate synthase [Alkalicaulis satelles]|uniref:3-dehydroquinate synthase n=1 Tax=Alkalicaulis satelles TaxID=2609175 RepID=A0A5M6ZGV7_9PROT|nr:3-dehydroquinate synthase [Alkalicaulis satelles]KAA5804003.1 3-dehydroquinate synthase [Alkalicaulis satelles]